MQHNKLLIETYLICVYSPRHQETEFLLTSIENWIFASAYNRSKFNQQRGGTHENELQEKPKQQKHLMCEYENLRKRKWDYGVPPTALECFRFIEMLPLFEIVAATQTHNTCSNNATHSIAGATYGHNYKCGCIYVEQKIV